MAVNNLTVEQASSIVNAVVAQAGGSSALANINTGSFTTVAQTALQMGYDPLTTAISQVLSRTIFSIRPYSSMFSGIIKAGDAYGNWKRKINIVDSGATDSPRWTLTNGQSVDPFKVNKPKIIQTNFYGSVEWSPEWLTVYDSQLDVAFSSPEEFGQFVTLLMTNMSDQREMQLENMARACIANLIGGIISGGNTYQIVKLLTEYNALTGLSLTATSVYAPDNYPAFMKWVYSKMASVAAMLRNRTSIFHTNITSGTVSGNIMRHTPYEMLKAYILADARYQTENRVLADTYHDTFIKWADVDTVSFWQSVQKPDSITVTPSYLSTDGTITTAEEALTQASIFAIMYDDQAMGVFPNNERINTMRNNIGEYTNFVPRGNYTYINDFTENAVVFLLA